MSKEEYKSRVYTERPAYADYDSAEKFEADSYERLVAITTDFSYGIKLAIMYDYRTGVMYAVNSNGGITPLYNPDGSLRIYTEG